MNDDINWRSVFAEHRNARLKDQELILRFLAMHERSDRYARPMREFLNDFADEYNALAPSTLARLKVLFAKSIKRILKQYFDASFEVVAMLEQVIR